MLNEVTYMGPLIIEKKGKFDVYLSSLPHLTRKHSDSKGSLGFIIYKVFLSSSTFSFEIVRDFIFFFFRFSFNSS